MEMVPCKLPEVIRDPKDTRIKYDEIPKLLDDFLDSDYKCVKVLGWDQANAHCCRCIIQGVIRRRHIVGVRVAVRDNAVFLLKKDI